MSASSGQTTFLDTVRDEYNAMRARSFAGGALAGITHVGIAIVALDTGRVFLTKRADDPTDDPEVRETWEFPGGGLRDGEPAWEGAVREVIEETGLALPTDHMVVNGWQSDSGVYQGFVVHTATEFGVNEWSPTTEVSDIGWFDYPAVKALEEVGALRPEVRDQTDWSKIFGEVSGNEEAPVPEDTPDALAAAADLTSTEPLLTLADVVGVAIPVHGVVAPEEVESGDGRGFNAGAMTSRPGRIPFRWQESDIGGHDGAVVTGSVDRMMRKDGLIHWEGLLMPTAKAADLVEMLAFFGRFGVSVDGDRGELAAEKSNATGVTWYSAVRAAGLTAVAIPAFSEAYVALGPHPDMPPRDAAPEALAASGIGADDIVTFDRGPGWVTNPRETKRIHDYWTKPGEEGYAKIAWGTSGDYTRCTRLVGEKIATNSPEDMRFIKQICAQWHHDALGYWPGDLGKPGNAPDTPENRRRAATHAAGETIEFAVEAEIETDETEDLLAAAHEASAEINQRAASEGWEPVLVSSAGTRVHPPASYFDRHPDTGALVIEEPDENGIRRTYGYAGEWGICHIGFDGRCVPVPEDPDGGTFPAFHLGRTRVSGNPESDYVNTGLITYMTEHRDGQTILSQTPKQAHFDNIANAWAAVRLGQDERGIWFSGVVLPHVPEDDLVVIEAAGQVSGEWKYGSLRTLLAVSVPGFPVMRSSAAYDDEGNVETLVATAFGDGVGECAPTPAERIAALAKVDAEVRMNRLREQFNWTDVAEQVVNEAIDEGRVEPVGLREDGAIVYEIDGEVPGTDTIAEPMPEGE